MGSSSPGRGKVGGSRPRSSPATRSRRSSGPAPTGPPPEFATGASWSCSTGGGLRVGEALSLYPKDLDSRRGTVRVLHGKGDKARAVGFDPEALAVVERWLDVRKDLRISSRRPLFCTLTGGPIDQSYVRQLLPRLAHRAGIDKRVHAHGLRHTHTAELAEEGYPVNFIQDQLGHASLAITDRYLGHIAPAARIEALRQRVWGLV